MIRILLIDDHAVVRLGVRQLMTEAYPDSQIGEAASATSAREALSHAAWDLVLLDISLPEGSGLELLAQAKARCPQAAVLVLSAYQEEEFAVRAFKLGAKGYLTKSGLADELLLAVRRVLGGGVYVSAAMADRLADALGNPERLALHDTLSPRELEVLCQVASGRTIKEVASALSLSEKTIATYRSRVSEKLHLSTNVELARYALQHHLVE